MNVYLKLQKIFVKSKTVLFEVQGRLCQKIVNNVLNISKGKIQGLLSVKEQ